MVLGLGPASQFHDAGVPSATPGAKPDDCCFFNFSKTWIANGGLQTLLDDAPTVSSVLAGSIAKPRCGFSSFLAGSPCGVHYSVPTPKTSWLHHRHQVDIDGSALRSWPHGPSQKKMRVFLDTGRPLQTGFTGHSHSGHDSQVGDRGHTPGSHSDHGSQVGDREPSTIEERHGDHHGSSSDTVQPLEKTEKHVSKPSDKEEEVDPIDESRNSSSSVAQREEEGDEKLAEGRGKGLEAKRQEEGHEERPVDHAGQVTPQVRDHESDGVDEVDPLKKKVTEHELERVEEVDPLKDKVGGSTHHSQPEELGSVDSSPPSTKQVGTSAHHDTLEEVDNSQIPEEERPLATKKQVGDEGSTDLVNEVEEPRTHPVGHSAQLDSDRVSEVDESRTHELGGSAQLGGSDRVREGEESRTHQVGDSAQLGGSDGVNQVEEPLDASLQEGPIKREEGQLHGTTLADERSELTEPERLKQEQEHLHSPSPVSTVHSQAESTLDTEAQARLREEDLPSSDLEAERLKLREEELSRAAKLQQPPPHVQTDLQSADAQSIEQLHKALYDSKEEALNERAADLERRELAVEKDEFELQQRKALELQQVGHTPPLTSDLTSQTSQVVSPLEEERLQQERAEDVYGSPPSTSPVPGEEHDAHEHSVSSPLPLQEQQLHNGSSDSLEPGHSTSDLEPGDLSGTSTNVHGSGGDIEEPVLSGPPDKVEKQVLEREGVLEKHQLQESRDLEHAETDLSEAQQHQLKLEEKRVETVKAEGTEPTPRELEEVSETQRREEHALADVRDEELHVAQGEENLAKLQAKEAQLKEHEVVPPSHEAHLREEAADELAGARVEEQHALGDKQLAKVASKEAEVLHEEERVESQEPHSQVGSTAELEDSAQERIDPTDKKAVTFEQYKIAHKDEGHDDAQLRKEWEKFEPKPVGSADEVVEDNGDGVHHATTTTPDEVVEDNGDGVHHATTTTQVGNGHEESLEEESSRPQSHGNGHESVEGESHSGGHSLATVQEQDTNLGSSSGNGHGTDEEARRLAEEATHKADLATKTAHEAEERTEQLQKTTQQLQKEVHSTPRASHDSHVSPGDSSEEVSEGHDSHSSTVQSPPPKATTHEPVVETTDHGSPDRHEEEHHHVSPPPSGSDTNTGEPVEPESEQLKKDKKEVPPSGSPTSDHDEDRSQNHSADVDEPVDTTIKPPKDTPQHEEEHVVQHEEHNNGGQSNNNNNNGEEGTSVSQPQSDHPPDTTSTTTSPDTTQEPVLEQEHPHKDTTTVTPTEHVSDHAQNADSHGGERTVEETPKKRELTEDEKQMCDKRNKWEEGPKEGEEPEEPKDVKCDGTIKDKAAVILQDVEQVQEHTAELRKEVEDEMPKGVVGKIEEEVQEVAEEGGLIKAEVPDFKKISKAGQFCGGAFENKGDHKQLRKRLLEGSQPTLNDCATAVAKDGREDCKGPDKDLCCSPKFYYDGTGDEKACRCVVNQGTCDQRKAPQGHENAFIWQLEGPGLAAERDEAEKITEDMQRVENQLGGAQAGSQSTQEPPLSLEEGDAHKLEEKAIASLIEATDWGKF